MSVVYRAEDEPVVSRREYWQHLMHELLAPLDLRLPEGDFRSKVVAAQMGAAEVFELTITEGEALRTPRLIRRSDPGLCKIDVLVEGRLVVEQDGRQACLRPGDFVFVDMSRPCHWVNTEPARNIALSFPRDLLPLKDRDLRGITGTALPGDQGVSRLVSSLARQLPGNLDEDRPSERAKLGVAVLDLLAVALAGRLERPVDLDVRANALLSQVHAYIEERLGDSDLTPLAVAAAHHISPRLLYKLFEAEGVGVAEWIRQRRLERCRRDLLDPAQRHRPAAAIAAHWGFREPAHFSRAFRAAYGLPPGEFRRRWGR